MKTNAAAYGKISPFLMAIPYQVDGIWKDDVSVKSKGELFKEGAGKITVTKQAGYIDPELMQIVDLIPQDVTYYVGIFEDAEGKNPYGTDFVNQL